MQEISEWLTEHNLGQYGQAFVDNGITVDLLEELNQEDLKEIGLTLGDRKRFLIAVRQGANLQSPGHAPGRVENSSEERPEHRSAGRSSAGHLTTEHSTAEHSTAERGFDGVDAVQSVNRVRQASTADSGAGALDTQTPPSGPRTTETHDAERRQLTVMFVDLVGSTALAEQLDPEDLGHVVRAYQSLVGRYIAEHGGYISRYMGDGVLAYFGWPTANEDDATHAVDSALAITASISSLKTPDGDPLSCRCGIATGLVVVGELIGEGPSREHAVVGETPNLAARLQGLAAENSTVISDTTRRLTGNQFEFHSLGLQQLKGIREPVPVFSVIAAKTVESRYHASRQHVALPLIGRQRQLEQLRFYWHQSATGHTTRVLLQGEAGIGKSRLLYAFIDSLDRTPYHRVILQCDPLRADSALYPATQYVMRLAGIAATDAQATRLQKLKSVTAALPPVEVAGLRCEILPLLTALLGVSDAADPRDITARADYSAEQVRLLTLHALATVMQAAVADTTDGSDRLQTIASTPLLLVLEDAHWIDPTTIELLAVMSQPDVAGNVMILVTARPEFEPTALPFEDLSTIQLPRLGVDACREVVSAVVGDQDLPDHVLNEIVLRTDGVPLFAEELTRTVIESNAIQTTSNESTSVQSLEIPSSLHDSLMSRLDRLQSPREVAQTAACIGREFSVDLLLAISPVDEVGLNTSLQTLIETGLVFSVSDSVYSFKHALVRDTAYESLLKSKRQQIHLQIGQVLKQQFPELLSSQPELAGYHFRRGASYIEASDYWHRAATLALQRVANQEAIAHASSGLECLALAEDEHTGVGIADIHLSAASPMHISTTDLSQKYDLLFARGMGYMAVHGYAAETVSSNFSAALEIASAMQDNERFSQAARGVVTAHIVSSRFDEGLALADTMLANAETSMQQFYALRMQGQIYLWQARFEDSRTCFEQAIALYESALQQSAQADADGQSVLSQWDDGVLCIGFLGITLTCLGQTDKGEQKHCQSVELANQLNQPFSQCQAMESWITSILLRGDDFSTQLSTFSQLADTHNMVFFQACAQMYLGIQYIRQGSVQSGIKILTDGLQSYQACQSKLGVPKWMTYVAEGYQSAGQYEQSIQLLDSAKIEMDNMGNEYFRAEWARVRAESLSRIAGCDPTESDSFFQQAASLARTQRAALFELTATTGYVRHKRGSGVGTGSGSGAGSDCSGKTDAHPERQLRQLIESFDDQRSFQHLATAKQLFDLLPDSSDETSEQLQV
jgi:predicted ATPase/class 3 adenylate cyclase